MWKSKTFLHRPKSPSERWFRNGFHSLLTPADATGTADVSFTVYIAILRVRHSYWGHKVGHALFDAQYACLVFRFHFVHNPRQFSVHPGLSMSHTLLSDPFLRAHFREKFQAAPLNYVRQVIWTRLLTRPQFFLGGWRLSGRGNTCSSRGTKLRPASNPAVHKFTS